MKTKSQVTFFILLAMLILFVVGILIFIKTKVTQKEVESEVEVTQTIPDDVKSVETFITSCLDDIARDALVLAGKQGGWIYAHNIPWGYSIPPDVAPGVTNIVFVKTDNGISYLEKLSEPENQDITKNYYLKYILSLSKIEPYIMTKFLNLNDDSISSLPDQTIKYQLEYYIFNRFKKECINFKELEKTGLIFDLDPSKVEIGVVIGSKSDNVVTNLKLPLKITEKKTNQEYSLRDFSTTQHIRLAKMYGYVTSYISKIKSEGLAGAYSKISDIEDDGISSSEFIETAGSRDAIGFRVVVKDTKSKINGKDYEFWFMQEPLELSYASYKLIKDIEASGNLVRDFNTEVAVPEYIENICIVGSDRDLPEYFKKFKKDSTYNNDFYSSIFNRLDLGENIFFLTKRMKSLDIPIYSWDMHTIPFSNHRLCNPEDMDIDCKNRLIFSARLSDIKIKLDYVPIACYTTTDGKIIFSGRLTGDTLGLYHKGVKESLLATISEPNGEISFGEGFVGNADYFYEGLKLVASNNNIDINRIILSYNYYAKPPVKITIETDSRNKLTPNLKLDVPQDKCVLEVDVVEVHNEKSVTVGCSIADKKITIEGGCEDDSDSVIINLKLKDQTTKNINKDIFNCKNTKEITLNEDIKDVVQCTAEIKYKKKEMLYPKTLKANDCNLPLKSYDVKY